MGNYPFFFFFSHIPESSQASIVYFSSLFPFVLIWTSVWSSVLHTNLFGTFFFFLAWLGVITVFHLIFINLLNFFAFDLLLVLIVSVCVRERVSTRVCMETGQISALLSFQILTALSWYTTQSWQRGSLVTPNACTWAPTLPTVASTECSRCTRRSPAGHPLALVQTRGKGQVSMWAVGWDRNPWATTLSSKSPLFIIFIRYYLEVLSYSNNWALSGSVDTNIL